MLVEGVEILETINSDSTPIFMIVFLVLCIILLSACTFGIIESFKDKDVGRSIFCIIIAAFALLFVIGIPLALGQERDTVYKVTISEDVAFVDFNNRYEIIDQNGKIFTIKERK